MAKIKLGLGVILLGGLLGFIALNMTSVEVSLVVMKPSVPVGFIAIGGALVGAFVTMLLFVLKSKSK